jgi:protein gp37
MAENTTIEWTDTTWNPVTGCTRISAGCDNCYARAVLGTVSRRARASLRKRF